MELNIGQADFGNMIENFDPLLISDSISILAALRFKAVMIMNVPRPTPFPKPFVVEDRKNKDVFSDTQNHGLYMTAILGKLVPEV